MISSIRNGIYKAGNKYIVWALLIIFTFSGTGVFINLFMRRQGNSVALINGYTITQLELRNKTLMLDQYIKDLRQQFGQHADYFLQMLGFTENPEEMAFKQLVREKLLMSVADGLGLKHLAPIYVEQKLMDPSFTMQHLSFLVPPALYGEKGELNENMLMQYLHRQNISYTDFEEQVEAALKQFFVFSLLSSTIFIAQESVKSAFAQEKGIRNFSILTVDLEDYVVQQKKPTQQELREYFSHHNIANKRYWTQETRSGKAWKFESATYGVAPDQFVRRFTDDARRVIGQHSPAALEEFIKKHGGKPVSLTKNQIFNPDSLPIAKLFSLKTGQTGTTVGLQEGYLVTLESIQERKMRSFEEVAAEVERDYIQEKAAQALTKEVADLMKSFSVESFEKFMKAKALKPQKLIVHASEWNQAEKVGLPVGRMEKMIHPGYAIAHPTREGIKIVVLNSFEFGNMSSITAAEKETIVKRLGKEETQLIAASFIASLQNNATIDYRNMQTK